MISEKYKRAFWWSVLIAFYVVTVTAVALAVYLTAIQMGAFEVDKNIVVIQEDENSKVTIATYKDPWFDFFDFKDTIVEDK